MGWATVALVTMERGVMFASVPSNDSIWLAFSLRTAASILVSYSALNASGKNHCRRSYPTAVGFYFDLILCSGFVQIL